MTHVIGEGMQVVLHFAVKLADGTIVDSNFDKAPATFQVGDGNLLTGFERVLFGLRAGDQREFNILPEQGFGMPNPNNVQRMIKADFAADITLEPGLMVSFADANKAEVAGVIKRVEGDLVEVDVNHPLAGCEVLFQVEILDVTPVH